MTRAPLQAWLLLALLAAIWGGSFMLTNLAVRDLPPFTVVALRLWLATALVWTYARARGAKVPLPGTTDGPRLAKFAVGAAIVGNVLPFSLISWGQLHIPSALSGLLMAPMPLMVLMLSHFLVAGERLTAHRVFGFVTGFAGVALLIGGVVITETVFNIPGIGRLVVDAIQYRDYPIIQGVMLLFSGVYVIVNLLVDLSYTLLDPRIRT